MTAKYPFFSFIIVCCVYKSGSNSWAKTKELFSEEVNFNFQRTISPVSAYNFLKVSVSLCSHSLKNFSGIYWCKNCSTVSSFLDETQPIFPVTFSFSVDLEHFYLCTHSVSAAKISSALKWDLGCNFWTGCTAKCLPAYFLRITFRMLYISFPPL